MNVLCIGDIVGSRGCEFLRQKLHGIKKEYNVNLVIANGENSADGNGITPASAEYILQSGVDVITNGNHTFRRREMYPVLESDERILRPANYHRSAPGRGMCIVDMGYTVAAVINLAGTAYSESAACPFDTAEELISQAREQDARVILIDFHGEATSEKRALGFYLDGRVAAIFGTHTHVQTADEQILPGGTGYITDLGMTGPYYSVLGVKTELAIEKQRTKLPVRFENADGERFLCGCVFAVDDKTGLATGVKRIEVKE